MSIIDSIHQICLDLEVPSVIVNKAQYSVLKGITARESETKGLKTEKIRANKLYVREK